MSVIRTGIENFVRAGDSVRDATGRAILRINPPGQHPHYRAMYAVPPVQRQITARRRRGQFA